MTDEEAFRSLVGGWQLVECATSHPDGGTSAPLGSGPLGQIMYSADGHMSAHLMPGADAPGTAPGYIGYFGRFSVDAATKVVTHHVAGASAEYLIDTDQPRGFTFDADLLILEADVPEGRARITWQRRDESRA